MSKSRGDQMEMRGRAPASFCLSLVFITAGIILNNILPFFVGIFLLFTFVPSILDLTIKQYFLRNTTCERTFNKTRLFAGETLDVSTKIRSKHFPFDCVEVNSSYPDVFEQVNGYQSFIIPSQENSFSHVLKCNNRGKYTLGKVGLTLCDRFGYCYTNFQLADEVAVTVFPTYEDIRRMEISGRSRQLGRLYGAHRARQIGIGSEFHGIRSYAPSDEWRRIAWRPFARHLKLMSKEYEGEKNIVVLICLDSSSTMKEGQKPTTKLEYAIRATLLLAKTAEERGDSYGLIVFAGTTKSYLSPGRGKKQYNWLLETLADVAGEGRTSFSLLADSIFSTLRRTALIIIISDLEGDFEDVKLAVQKLRARGHGVLVICPFTPRFQLQAQEDEVLDALASALVEKFESELDYIAGELKKLGVDCIDVGPQDFLPMAVEKFLEKKKLGVAIV